MNYKKIMASKGTLGILAAVLILSILFFTTTNPRQLPAALLMVGFVLLFLLLFLVLRIALKLLMDRHEVIRGHYKPLLAAGSGVPVLLLLLQSIGQLTFRDLFTLAALVLAGLFYISRMSTDVPSR